MPDTITKLNLPITFIPSPDVYSFPLCFVISDCPREAHFAEYIHQFREHNVKCLIRLCDASAYDEKVFEAQSQHSDDPNITYSSIKVHDEIKFMDGSPPSEENVQVFLELVAMTINQDQEKNHQRHGRTTRLPSLSSPHTESIPLDSIAIHCVSGLGRAPILVAVAILEYCDKLDVLDVVEWLRKFRKGVLNKAQLKWLVDVFDKKLKRKWWNKRNGKYRNMKRSESVPLLPINTNNCDILTPPENFGIVERDLYRSNALSPVNFSFLKTLQLKTIILLSSEAPTKSVLNFISESQITLHHLGILPISSNMGTNLQSTPKLEALLGTAPASSSWRPISEELVKEALEIITNTQYYPLMVICTSGIHETGTLIGCLRKLQGWTWSSILLEYRGFAGGKSRLANEQFIELFDLDLVALTHTTPQWLFD